MSYHIIVILYYYYMKVTCNIIDLFILLFYFMLSIQIHATHFVRQEKCKLSFSNKCLRFVIDKLQSLCHQC